MTPPVALLALLLQQPRDLRIAAHGGSAISGVIVSDDLDARPVRHARVTLTGPEASTAISDERGRFVFVDLPPGRYQIAATKAAWIAASYGARRPGRPGSALPLEEGQQLEVTLRMARGSVLSGVVLDSNGEPAARSAVQAMHYAIVDGERRLVPAGAAAIADDRGAYRIYGLPPGEYAVQASVRGVVQELLYLTTDLDLRYATSAAHTRPPAPRTVRFAATFYPSATNASQATMIAIRAGEERDDIDIQMQLEPTVRVEGVVAPVEMDVPPGTEVVLVSVAPSGALPGAAVDGTDRRRVGSDGAFVFPNLAPGTYTLIARAAKPTTLVDGSAGPPQFMWTSTQITVAGEPVTGIVLSLQPGMRVSGRVGFQKTRLSVPDMSSVRVTLQPVLAPGLVGFAPVPVSPSADGSFTINGVTPGRYRLTAAVPGSGRAGGWTLRSAVVNGQDTLDEPMTIQANQNVTDAAVTFVDRAATLTGTVVEASGRVAAGCAVVVFPTDPSLWLAQARRIQAVRSSADGAFSFAGLAAGEYVVAATDDAEPGEWYDPAFLQRLLPAGTKLAIGEAQQTTLELKAGGGR